MPRRPRKPGPIPTLKHPIQRWVQIEQADLRQAVSGSTKKVSCTG